tara:strand:- start:400 stop:687 length:288 start_codon:yes stop_codon:yes gene_type:complete
MMQKNVEIFSMLEGGSQSLIVLQTSIAMGIEVGLQPNVATSAESLDVEGLLEESTSRCGQLLLTLELRTMLLVQDPSMVHRELSIQAFGLIGPSA